MLCEHGNIAPCAECDVAPLKAENEALRAQLKEYEEKGRVLMDISRDLKAQVTELKGKNAEFAAALKEKMILTEGAYVLRKQAEAVEKFGQEIGVFDPEYDDQEYVEVPRCEVKAYAQHLRQQADEIEQAGGEK